MPVSIARFVAAEDDFAFEEYLDGIIAFGLQSADLDVEDRLLDGPASGVIVTVGASCAWNCRTSKSSVQYKAISRASGWRILVSFT